MALASTSTATPHFLTRCYIIALALIGIMSIASHIVLAEALKTNEGSARIINMSGRQRMLSQRIVALSAELIAGDEDARGKLATATLQLRESHAHLLRLAADAPPPVGVALRSAYFGADAIDLRMTRFGKAAERIAQLPAGVGAAAFHAGDFALLSAEARGPLLAGLEHIVQIQQRASEDRSNRLMTIQWSILAVVIVTLLVEALFIFRPMARRLAEHVRQLMHLVDVDFLTGLNNRRSFSERSARLIDQAQRHDRPAAVMLIDADHFKRVNDEHGHPAGDTVLVALARALQDGARSCDVVGRIGGEEFAILLPETTVAEAVMIAERVRSRIAAKTIAVDGHQLVQTVSIGVGRVPIEQDDPLACALKVADTMLYKAKAAGRNRVWPMLEPTSEAILEPVVTPELEQRRVA